MAEVILHLGAHGTDEGLIASWLMRNAQPLAALGVLALPAGRFLAALAGAMPEAHRPDDAGEAGRGSGSASGLLAALGVGDDCRRLVVSAPSLLGAASEVLAPGGGYFRNGARRLGWVRAQLPKDAALTLCLAVGSARLVLPALLVGAAGRSAPSVDAGLDMPGPGGLPWADLVGQLREQLPDARLAVWRHEDLPRLWPQVLATIVGTEQDLPVDGAGDFALLGHRAEAQERMRRYLAAKPPPTIALMRRVADAFAAGYGLAEVTPSPALRRLPVALQDRIARMDEGYEAEVVRIAAMPGVRVLGRDEPASG